MHYISIFIYKANNYPTSNLKEHCRDKIKEINYTYSYKHCQSLINKAKIGLEYNYIVEYINKMDLKCKLKE